MTAAALAAVCGLALPATAARAGTSGYAPPAAEWWMTSWSVPQQVWPVTQGAGTTVAVLDSGVAATAPDLKGTVLAGTDTVTPGGDGDRDYAPAPGHGTLSAEMIAGQGTGGGPVGLAPRARILPVRVDGPGPASPASVPAGIRYAVQHGASVISLSFGIRYQSATFCEPPVQAAVSYALAHNVVVVADAGDASPGSKGLVEPASCSGALAVGGIEPTGKLWAHSTLAPYVSVAAPADRVPVTGPAGQPGTASGTSYSASLVAATAALIRSRYPKMPWYRVDQRIIGTTASVPPAENNDYGFGYGYGILNVAHAVNASKYPVPASAPNPPYIRYVAWLNTMNGQAWAQANGVTVPAPGGVSGNSGSTTLPAQVRKLLTRGHLLAGGVIAAIVVLVLTAALLLILRARRKRRLAGPADPAWPAGVPGSPDAPSAFETPEAFPVPVPDTEAEPEAETAQRPQDSPGT